MPSCLKMILSDSRRRHHYPNFLCSYLHQEEGHENANNADGEKIDFPPEWYGNPFCKQGFPFVHSFQYEEDNPRDEGYPSDYCD